MANVLVTVRAHLFQLRISQKNRKEREKKDVYDYLSVHGNKSDSWQILEAKACLGFMT